MALGAVIGALRVNLGLNSADFRRGAARVRDDVARLGRMLAGIGAAVTAVTGGLGAITTEAAGAAREIDNLARAAGTTPEQFQRLAVAAGRYGLEQDALSDGLRDFRERIGEFVQTGGGGFADFMEQIAPQVGVTADQFARLSGPEALQLYVDSLEAAGLSTEEMSFFLESMASDFTLLIPALRDGGAEARRLADEIEALGGIMSNEQVAALSAAQGATTRLTTAFTGMTRTIAAEAAPAFTALADAMTGLVREGGPVRAALELIAANIQMIVTVVATAAVAWGTTYVVAVGAAAAATLTLSGALVTLSRAMVRTGIGALVVAAGILIDRFIQLRMAGLGVGEALAMVGDLGMAVVNRLGRAFAEGANTILSTFRGLYAALVQVFREIGDTAEMAFQVAMKAVVALVNTMLEATRSAINDMLRDSGSVFDVLLKALPLPVRMALGIIPVPELTITGSWAIPDPFPEIERKAGSSAQRIFAEFKRAFDEGVIDLDALGVPFPDAPTVEEAWGAIQRAIAAAGDEAETSTAQIEEMVRALERAGVTGVAGGAGGGGAPGQGDGAAAPRPFLLREDLPPTADVERVTDAFAGLRDMGEGMKASFSEAFRAIADGSKTAKEAALDMLNSIAGRFVDRGLDTLFDTLFRIGGQVLGSTFGGPSYAGGFSALNNGISAPVSVPGFANGVRNFRGGLAVVGERGREIVDLPRGSNVYNAASSRLMAQGAGAEGRVRVVIEPSTEFDARIRESAAGTAVEVVTATAPGIARREVADATRHNRIVRGRG